MQIIDILWIFWFYFFVGWIILISLPIISYIKIYLLKEKNTTFKKEWNEFTKRVDWSLSLVVLFFWSLVLIFIIEILYDDYTSDKKQKRYVRDITIQNEELVQYGVKK